MRRSLQAEPPARTVADAQYAFGLKLHRWEYFVRSDDAGTVEELREIFTGLELLPHTAARSGVTVKMREEAPALQFTLGGAPVDPLELLRGPEWRSLSSAPGQPHLLKDSILGLPYPVLETRGTELRVLQPEHWTRYVQGMTFHMMRVEHPIIGLHAAIAAVHDHTLVLVGGSGHGKSTLAGALHQAGGECYGDDVTFVTLDDYRIHAPTRSISIRPDGLDLIRDAPAARWFAPNPADPKWLVELPHRDRP
jgi:hypothetical protein